MNKIIITFIIGLISFSVFPQSKEITLEDIWQNHSFYYKSYRGFKSMNNGEFYTKMKKTDNGQEIIKYNVPRGLFECSGFSFKVGKEEIDFLEKLDYINFKAKEKKLIDSIECVHDIY